MTWNTENTAGRRAAADMIAAARQDRSGAALAGVVAEIRKATADESGVGVGFLFQIAAAAAGVIIAR